MYKILPPVSFIYCCFNLDFTSADIIFQKFLEFHSTLFEKGFFATNFPFLTDLLKPCFLILYEGF